MSNSRRMAWYVHPISWLGILLLYAPLAFVAVQSFNSSRHGQTWGGFTFDWYIKLVHNTSVQHAVWVTLLVAVASTLLATVSGTLLAVALHRTPWPRKIRHLLDTAVHLPVVTPDILMAVALVGIYGLLRLVSPLFDPGIVTLIIGHAVFEVSFVTLVVLSRLSDIGPEQMEAARDLYATTWQAWRRVILPQLSTGIVAGALLAFTLSLDDFIISFFVSGPGSTTLPLLIYSSLRRGLSPEIHALGTIVVTLTLLVMIGLTFHAEWKEKETAWARFGRNALRTLGVLLVVSLAGIAWYGKHAKPKPVGDGKPVVTVLMYSEYIDPDMLPLFTETTGYPLRIELYEAQEEMIGKLQAAGTGMYDVVVATDVVIRQMINLQLLSPLDTSRLPSRRNIDARFQSPPFDPDNRYTVPYMWGTTGILYRNLDLSPDSVRWDMLGKAGGPLAGNFSLLDESLTMLSMGLQALGKDPNSKAPEDIRAAADWLMQRKAQSNCLGFDGSVAGKDKVLGGTAMAAVVFNGEAAAAIGEDTTLQFAVPLEGSNIWVDVMTITSNAPNPSGAHAFMEWILQPSIGARNANWVAYGSPNAAAMDSIDAEMREDVVVYPDSTILARLLFLKDPGRAARLLDEAWTTVKSR